MISFSVSQAFNSLQQGREMGSVETAPFREVNIPQQKVVNGVPFPLVLSPESSAATKLAEAVRTRKTWLEGRLRDAGAILFREFDNPTASEFNDVVESFGYDDVPFMAGAAPRTHVIGRIFTSNDGPAHLTLQFHNEMAYIVDHPSKAFFYCEIEPGSQGETPIALGHVVFERLKQKHSVFLQRLEEHGLIYYKVLADETDHSSPIGRSWKSTFATDDKTIAEQKAAQIGWKLEWLEGGVRVTMGPVPGIKVDETLPEERRRMWFNNLLPAFANYVDARNEAGKAVVLGDGTLIPPEVVEDCKTILEEECATIPWRQGDVLLLNNWAVQHARRPFTPPRRVLAAFTK